MNQKCYLSCKEGELHAEPLQEECGRQIKGSNIPLHLALVRLPLGLFQTSLVQDEYSQIEESPVKSHQDNSELDHILHEVRWKGYLIGACTYLKGSYKGGGAKLFLVVYSAIRRGKSHKVWLGY